MSSRLHDGRAPGSSLAQAGNKQTRRAQMRNRRGERKHSGRLLTVITQTVFSLSSRLLTLWNILRVLESIPAAHVWRQVTPLNGSPAHRRVLCPRYCQMHCQITLEQGTKLCSRVIWQCSGGVLPLLPEHLQHFCPHIKTKLPLPKFEMSSLKMN